MSELQELQLIGFAVILGLTLFGLVFEVGRARFDPPGPRDHGGR